MITLAKDGMRGDLERIWRSCFPEDPPEYVKYFFDNRYNPNACVVYIDDEGGRPVSMIHMLDATITEDSEVVPVQYIYAAATRADHRGRGIMHRLMEYARRYAVAKRQKYMVLVPGSRELFRFYEKMGFYRCFKVRSVYMTRDDLIKLSGYNKNKTGRGAERTAMLSISDIASVRRDILVDREGFIGWDAQAVKYAAGVHSVSNGSIVTVADGSDAGYAFVRSDSPGSVQITEFIAHSGFDKALVKAVLDACDAEKFELRVPVFDEFFSSFGEIIDYGMIRHVADKKPVGLLTLTGSHIPYIGLALD